MSQLRDQLFEMTRDMNDQRRLGMEHERAEAARLVGQLVAVYDKLKNDPNARIPTALHLAIENLRRKYAP